MKRHYIGIDIGGTNLRFALAKSDGGIIARYRTESCIQEGRTAFCERLLGGIDEMRKAAGVAGITVSGIGAGVPGLIDSNGVIRSSVNMRPLDGFNLASFIEAETGLSATCLNDANLIALGEFGFGAGQAYRSLMVVTLGTGFGSGLILDGRLWTGTAGFAAEFGHVTVEPEGAVCTCGNRGCLEQYVSAGAIVRMFREHAHQGSGNMADIIDARLLAEMALAGELAARRAYERAGEKFGLALASLANTLNLEAVVICGGVSASLDLMMPSLKKEFDRRCFPEIAQCFKIVSGTLGDDAGLMGAAWLASRRGEIW